MVKANAAAAAKYENVTRAIKGLIRGFDDCIE